jgi:hypothetical protein
MHDRACDVEAFDCGDDANRGCDRTISEQHCRADHDDCRNETEGDGGAILLRWYRAREQRENTPFTVVIDSHDERDVLKAHDDDERPHEKRCDAEDIVCMRRIGTAHGEARLEGIERARTDVAEDDTECGNREGRERLFPGYRDETLQQKIADVCTMTVPLAV